jgi:hypothetical protein
MTDRTRTPKSIARSDMIGMACAAFSAGMMLNVATLSFVKGDQLGWVHAGCAVAMASAAFFAGRRTLRKIP